MSGCVCPLAGYCDRHSVKKTSNLHRLCQQGGAYWEAWEQGTGPGQALPHDDDRARKMKERSARVKLAVAKRERLIGWLKFFRIATDAGLGDTVMRLKRLAGKRAIKDDIRQVERMCSCQTKDAIQKLNEQHPY